MESVGEFILGIDLGTNSLGWGIVRLVDGVPAGFERIGVRVFPAGVNIDPKTGKESTRNTQRRDARLGRKQTWRRARRLTKVFNLLQRHGLLPEGAAPTPLDRQKLINELDGDIRASDWFSARAKSGIFPQPAQTVPYILRALALDERLEPAHLGRAFYHLAQRRGFWSNRKRPPRKNEKPGVVEPEIQSLDAEMKANGSRTLGEQFARLSPFEPRRIRDRHTSRAMYQHEFKEMWNAQALHHASLTDELRDRLFHALFDQRKGKLRKGLVGRCEFEPDERRAPACCLVYQRYRLLQALNNFKYKVRGGPEQSLTCSQRKKLIEALEQNESMKFKQVRELLGLTRRHSINLQHDKDEERMRGNDTGSQLARVFGKHWIELSEADQDKVLNDVVSILSVQDVETRRARAEKYLKNRGVENPEAALEPFVNITFEDGYASLSLKAIARFMPLLKSGVPYGALSPHYRELTPETITRLNELGKNGVPPSEACAQVLTAEPERHEPLRSLPPVTSEEVARRIGAIRNPIVVRSLTELRKVVNALVEFYGRPTRVHIELLRELKKPKDVREKIWKENSSRERLNEHIGKRILEEAGIPASSKDLEKYKLWDEAFPSANKCPYCLGNMSRTNLFGDDAVYQIDHIIPRERSLDDSFVNKVLCHTDCNRRKGNRTPWEAFAPENGGDADVWDRILRSVAGFGGDKRVVEEKLRRFKMDAKALEEFLKARESRQFNDAAYASRVAADYIALLYGGRTDADGNLRVQVRSGGLTQHFREAWGLNAILGDGPNSDGGKTAKPRHDHRHHAIDAAVIAVTDQDMVTRLNEAARRREIGRHGRFGQFDEPWSGFKAELREEVLDRVVVSHRVSKKVSGSLHKDTNYSVNDKVYGKGVRRHRVLVTELGRQDVIGDEVIADPAVRKRLRDLLGDCEPKKVFAGSPPFFEAKDGRRIPIRKVRINEVVKTRQIGSGYRARFVKPENNHHLEIFAILDPKDPVTELAWNSDGVVTTLEALRRLQDQKQDGIDRPSAIKTDGFGENTKFKFSIAPGEILECDAERKGQKLIASRLSGEEKRAGRVRLVVRSISQEEKTGSIKVEMVHITDARRKKQIQDSDCWVTKAPSELFKWNAKKIVVTPLGEVHEAHD